MEVAARTETGKGKRYQNGDDLAQSQQSIMHMHADILHFFVQKYASCG
jgi:hypothetical protein